jgi:hypothetical protein
MPVAAAGGTNLYFRSSGLFAAVTCHAGRDIGMLTLERRKMLPSVPVI